MEHTHYFRNNAPPLLDYLAIHWYVGNDTKRGFANDDFASYMAISERLENYLSATEGIIRAMSSQLKLKRDIPIAVDEWNVWYRTGNDEKLEEIYNLEDALVVAMHFNAFIRHAKSVKMANIAQIVNVIAPIMTQPDGLVLQTTFYPFEVFRQTCGDTALDVYWDGDTFAAAGFSGLRTLDVSATLKDKKVSVYIVNRSLEESEVQLELQSGSFTGAGKAYVVNGPRHQGCEYLRHTPRGRYG